MLVLSEEAVAAEVVGITKAPVRIGARVTRPLVAPRSSPMTWSSTLGQQDLATLLGVIENQLIPQLLADFTPAKQSPLDAPLRRRR